MTAPTLSTPAKGEESKAKQRKRSERYRDRKSTDKELHERGMAAFTSIHPLPVRRPASRNEPDLPEWMKICGFTTPSNLDCLTAFTNTRKLARLFHPDSQTRLLMHNNLVTPEMNTRFSEGSTEINSAFYHSPDWEDDLAGTTGISVVLGLLTKGGAKKHRTKPAKNQTPNSNPRPTKDQPTLPTQRNDWHSMNSIHEVKHNTAELLLFSST